MFIELPVLGVRRAAKNDASRRVDVGEELRLVCETVYPSPTTSRSSRLAGLPLLWIAVTDRRAGERVERGNAGGGPAAGTSTAGPPAAP